jgi:hypothetical protein
MPQHTVIDLPRLIFPMQVTPRSLEKMELSVTFGVIQLPDGSPVIRRTQPKISTASLRSVSFAEVLELSYQTIIQLLESVERS